MSCFVCTASAANKFHSLNFHFIFHLTATHHGQLRNGQTAVVITSKTCCL